MDDDIVDLPSLAPPPADRRPMFGQGASVERREPVVSRRPTRAQRR